MGYRSHETKKDGYLQELRRIRKGLEEQLDQRQHQAHTLLEQAVLGCKIADLDREIARVHYGIDGV